MRTNSTILCEIALPPLVSVELSAGPSRMSPELANVPPVAKVDVTIQRSTHSNQTQHNQVTETANATWGSYVELSNPVCGAHIPWPSSTLQSFNAVRASTTILGSNKAYSALSASTRREH